MAIFTLVPDKGIMLPMVTFTLVPDKGIIPDKGIMLPWLSLPWYQIKVLCYHGYLYLGTR